MAFFARGAAVDGWGVALYHRPIVAAIRTLIAAIGLFFAPSILQAEVIYRAEESDGSVSFTHYADRDCLEVFIDDELSQRPAEMAAVDPATVYANLDSYDDLILEAAGRHQVSPALIKAVVLVESGFNARALSPKGAMGLMQLMPGTAEELGVAEPFDPAQSISGGTAYLRKMLDRYGGNRDKAIAAYNAGPGRVDEYGGTPPIPETQFFVRNVSRFYDYFSTERPLWSAP